MPCRLLIPAEINREISFPKQKYAMDLKVKLPRKKSNQRARLFARCNCRGVAVIFMNQSVHAITGAIGSVRRGLEMLWQVYCKTIWMCKGNVPTLRIWNRSRRVWVNHDFGPISCAGPKKNSNKNSVKKNTPVALLYDCFLFMQEQFALNEPIAPLSKSHSDPNNIKIDNIHVSKNDENKHFIWKMLTYLS